MSHDEPVQTSKTARVTSPAATGGAGTFFEQHVGAYWLAHLLVRGIPPILHDCAVVEVHFQTEHLGWHTDDFLIIGDNASGDPRRLAGQVKRTFSVSATDDECRQAVRDFWKDFGSGHFSPTTDRFALVTLRGTNTLLEHFSGLLDCARSAHDATEFEHRLATPGFISARAIHYCEEIRSIIDEVEGRSISAAEAWPFLRLLHVLSLDLNTPTRQTEAVIMTLLAHTTREQNAIGAARASWNALLAEIGEGMPAARSFRRDDLPELLRQRHSPVGDSEQRVLRALNDHSAIILDGIRSTIGSDLHLGRDRLVHQVIEQLESSQVVLISGAAGSGKSSVAKDVIRILAADQFAFSFRAEEFAYPHLDETLHSNRIPASAATLGGILATQTRKVLLVESVERLLEKSTRDAFADLLTLMARDRSWRLVLTCRDYSTDLVRAGLLGLATLSHSVVSVSGLDDDELRMIEIACPALARPLANPALRGLLRNPYVLDRALQISWSGEHALPQSERELRALFWQEIVRAEHRAGGGMPRRREQVFLQVALRRARALTLYAPCADLDPEAIDGLRRDSLVISSPHSRVLMATSHDVLEDWAILQWIEEQHATNYGEPRDLCSAIGTHPAVRRTYRKWVSELVERSAAAGDRLFQAALLDHELPNHFRDDTLVSLLRSQSSAGFLERHRGELFANEKDLLRRVIHLLRVACVTAPAWLKPLTAPVSLFNVPDGPAWPCVLRLVQSHLHSFSHEDQPLLLGLVEDWSRGVTWQTPYPDGAGSVAAIAHSLLAGFDDYRSADERKRTLRMIAKIPNADPERFAILLRRGRADEERDRTADDFREIIFEGLEGTPAARDMPDDLVSAAHAYLLCSEDDLRDEFGWGYAASLELEPLFGIKVGRSHDFFPASAYRGPFLPLLRYHRRKGLDFIIAVFNHSAEWYARPKVPSHSIEPPFEITLRFEDGTSRNQWCNARLWNLYRGTSVGPYVLQSLLMALETWLLELAEARPQDLDRVLLHILRRSESAALTAVVASAATAFPRLSGEALLVLLQSPECIRLDRRRLATESQTPSGLSGVMPEFDTRNRIYEEERKAADALSHRRHDLEMAIANLQLGPLAARVHEILDRHRASMRPVQEQDENDRVWRLALHRMDLRQYAVGEQAEEADTDQEPGSPEGGRYIRLELKVPDPDVKEMVDRSATQMETLNERLGLLMWALKVFGREDDATYDPAQWRQRLEAARLASADVSGEDHALGQGGRGFVAAVCVRDHWEEMSGDEQNWCVERVCSEVERESDHWNEFSRVQRNTMSADRPCAWVLPALCGKALDAQLRERVRRALAGALTHAIDEVRWYAASGIGTHLWAVDRELTFRCVNALAAEAMLLQQAADANLRRSDRRRRSMDEIASEAASTIRRRFFEKDGISSEAHTAFDPSRWFGAEANRRILTILGQAPTDPPAIAAFARLALTLVGWWDEDDGRRRSRNQPRHERNHHTESALSYLLQEFLLRTSLPAATAILQPVLAAVDRHPRNVSWVVQGLIGIEDRQPNTQQFWSLWELFADRVRRATWLSRIDDEHPWGAEMVSAVFLGTWWKEEARHWRSLEGHANHVHILFEGLPPSSTVLEDYLRFLYHVGEQSLPEAFIRIAHQLRQGDPRQMIRKGNTVFLLEVLLQRYVYGRPLELKRLSDLREAILFLLDMLVENGSSAAFRMRDDFVTPAAVG